MITVKQLISMLLIRMQGENHFSVYQSLNIELNSTDNTSFVITNNEKEPKTK